jgi:hypothetical protein
LSTASTATVWPPIQIAQWRGHQRELQRARFVGSICLRRSSSRVRSRSAFFSWLAMTRAAASG